MAVSLTVRVHDGRPDVASSGVWQTIAEPANLRMRRRVGSGEASFTVNDATLAELALLRTGRECEIILVVDGVTVSFGGFLDRPKIEGVSPGHFSIQVKVVDLTTGANWHVIGKLYNDVGTKYTDIIKAMWEAPLPAAGGWPEVDRGGVADDALTAPDDIPITAATLSQATQDIVSRYLVDYVWFVRRTGSNDASGLLKELVVSNRAIVDKTGSVTLDEMDVGLSPTFEPVIDPRSWYLVVGDDDSAVDLGWPMFSVLPSDDSQAAFGNRWMLLKQGSEDDEGALGLIAIAAKSRNQFDLWQGSLKVPDWTLEPGDKILLRLPTLGINDGGNGLPWLIEEVEEAVSQGKAERVITLVETNDAAAIRLGV